jgi:hypothetical protein
MGQSRREADRTPNDRRAPSPIQADEDETPAKTMALYDEEISGSGIETKTDPVPESLNAFDTGQSVRNKR